MKEILTKNLMLIMLGLLIFPLTSISQDEITIEPGVDVVSRYVWRGTDFGNSPSIQPYVELGFGGLAAGAWGSYATNGANMQEADLYVSYTFDEIFTLMVTDYFFPNALAANNNYFEYDFGKTGHIFEGAAIFNGTDDIPVSLMVAANFAGADAMTYDGKLQYSTYVELGYSTTINQTEVSAFLGGTPTKPDKEKGEGGFYGPHEGVINIGVTAAKEVEISDKFSLPVSVSVITNPQQENIFFVVGISL